MMKHWMFRCRDVSQKVSQSMDGRLPLRDRMAIRFHLMMCRYCARFRHQLLMLRKMSRHIDSEHPDCSPPADLTEESKERMKKNLRDLS